MGRKLDVNISDDKSKIEIGKKISFSSAFFTLIT